jgi:hypothetical protein
MKTIKAIIKKNVNTQSQEIYWEGGTLAENLQQGWVLESSNSQPSNQDGYIITEITYQLKQKTQNLLLG